MNLRLLFAVAVLGLAPLVFTASSVVAQSTDTDTVKTPSPPPPEPSK